MGGWGKEGEEEEVKRMRKKRRRFLRRVGLGMVQKPK